MRTTLIYDLPCGWLYCWPFQRLAFPIRLVLQVCNEHYTHLLFWRIGWASTISEIGCCHFGKSNSPLLVVQVLLRPSKHQSALNFCLRFWLCMPLSISYIQNTVLKKNNKKFKPYLLLFEVESGPNSDTNPISFEAYNSINLSHVLWRRAINHYKNK